jgi:hypothetical protein
MERGNRTMTYAVPLKGKIPNPVFLKMPLDINAVLTLNLSGEIPEDTKKKIDATIARNVQVIAVEACNDVSNIRDYRQDDLQHTVYRLIYRLLNETGVQMEKVNIE